VVIQCPHCQNSIGLKSAKPGRYATKCPKCSERFQLTVPADPDGTPQVKPLSSEAPTAATSAVSTEGQGTGTSDTNATAAPPAARTSETMAATGVRDANVTGDFSATVAKPAATELATDAQGFQIASGATGRPEGVPALLGGYQVLRELGRGGMGAVYLARQLSLDRNVALKVMKPEWASNPTFVSRFTREAYAAAQLVHHNVVQIYDFGEDRGTNFFSMEFVQGRTLTAVLREKKKLDPEVAVGYVLQAARGLKYAHDQSMIHRDIKPDNLMVNDQGVVKVADLGLVKTPAMAEAEVAVERGTAAVLPPGRSSPAASSGQITVANVAMGTPAFMAPEQARDASSVDARADIYSLGCTLYDLVTGRPPFEGKTAIELITKHQSEPVVPPERFAPRLSRELSEIIMKMIAKKPEERYSSLGEVIKGFEDYLGIQTTGVFSPREEHANLLEESVRQFNASPMARLRPKLLLGGAGACALVVLLSLAAGQLKLAAGFLGLGVMTALLYFIIDGVTRKSYLFLKTRELVLGGTLSDWLTIAAGVVLIFGLVVVFKMFWAWLAFGVVAGVVAWGLHAAVDRKVEAERHESVEQVEQMIRGLRLKGLDEDTLRQFVCKYGGDHWEEFYEELFGYEAKLIARDKWGRSDRGRLRPKFAFWRDPIVSAIDAKQQARRAAREQKLLQKIEEKGLEAQGVNLLTARRKARRAAEAMVATAAEVRASARTAEIQGGERLSIGKSLKHAVDKPEDVLVEKETGTTESRLEGPLNLVLGGRTRFLVGAALIAGCLMWMDQNKILDTEQIKATATELHKVATKAAESKDVGDVLDVKVNVDAAKHVNQEAINREHEPLSFPGLPAALGKLFNSFNPGIAGLILVVSSFFRGWRMSLFALPGAAVALLGPAVLAVPSSQPLDIRNLITMAAGGALLVVGFFLGRAR